MPKDTSWAKAMSNSEKIKPIAFVVIDLQLSEGISQSAVLKFCHKFVKVVLKAYLG